MGENKNIFWNLKYHLKDQLDQISIPEYFLKLTHSSNFVKNENESENELAKNCTSENLADYQKMSKRELLLLAKDHMLQPKNHWLKQDLVNKLMYHFRVVHLVSFEPDISKFL